MHDIIIFINNCWLWSWKITLQGLNCSRRRVIMRKLAKLWMDHRSAKVANDDLKLETAKSSSQESTSEVGSNDVSEAPDIDATDDSHGTSSFIQNSKVHSHSELLRDIEALSQQNRQVIEQNRLV